MSGPRGRLCWQQDPATLVRCDRRTRHLGLHTWEWTALRARHSEAVEKAFREGSCWWVLLPKAGSLDNAWLASEAKKGLT
jgi:hypothetical protein